LEPIRIFADRLKSLDGRTDIRDVDLNARFRNPRAFDFQHSAALALNA
jgi:hypothetical protein